MKFCLAILLFVFSSWVHATCATNVYVVDGSEVTDTQTGLIWSRCLVGQTWDGATCAGSASEMTHEQAFAAAKSQTNAWRLPNVKELYSLCPGSNANDGIFPGIVRGNYWSSTPVVESPGVMAYMVDFTANAVRYSAVFRQNTGYVRLVRFAR